MRLSAEEMASVDVASPLHSEEVSANNKNPRTPAMKTIETIKTSTAQKTASLNVKTSLKAGGLGTGNHNRNLLTVRTSLKAGGLGTGNHNRKLVA